MNKELPKKAEERRLSELRKPIDDKDTSRKLTQDIAIHSIDDIQVKLNLTQLKAENEELQKTKSEKNKELSQLATANEQVNTIRY